jgi:hypothetical protein
MLSRSHERRRPASLASSFNADMSSKRGVRQAGAMPKRIPTLSESRSANENTRQSSGASMVRGMLAGLRLSNKGIDQRVSKIPAAPPATESNTLSVSIWRTMRNRVAPSELRIASSRRRVMARAKRRLAALAQAITNTRATTAISKPVNAATYPRARHEIHRINGRVSHVIAVRPMQSAG